MQHTVYVRLKMLHTRWPTFSMLRSVGEKKRAWHDVITYMLGHVTRYKVSPCPLLIWQPQVPGDSIKTFEVSSQEPDTHSQDLFIATSEPVTYTSRPKLTNLWEK